jgi:hypothetical protein
MEKQFTAPGAPRTIESAANQKGIHGSMAALRRLLEGIIRRGDDFSGGAMLIVNFQNDTILSYKANVLAPPP